MFDSGKIIKILAIGNSFSQDATAYLHQIADSGGIKNKVVNLYIGGCSLLRHCRNIESGEAAYSYELNGESTGTFISVGDALDSDDWDIVTVQQVSQFSGITETFYPYLYTLAAYVREKAPKAKLYFHQTWSYAPDSTHEGFVLYSSDSLLMERRIVHAVASAAKSINADIIPVGEAVGRTRATKEFDLTSGGLSLNRDGFHLSIPYGRYLAAAVWYETLMKGDIRNNSFVPGTQDGEIKPELLEIIKSCVHNG